MPRLPPPVRLDKGRAPGTEAPPTGADIESNTRGVLEAVTGARPWRRVALTKAQVLAHGIPAVRKHDRVKNITADAYEVEALGQAVVTGLVRQALDALLPEPLARVLDREARQRQAVADTLDLEG